MPTRSTLATARSGGHRAGRRSSPLWAVVAAVLLLVMPASVVGQSPSGPGASLTLGAPDEMLVQTYLDQGVGQVGSVFLAMTQVTVEPVGDLGAHVVATFPTGSSADMLVTLTPDQAGDPGLIDVTATMTDTGVAFRFSYFVPYAAMPPDVEQTIRVAAPSAPVGGVTARLVLAVDPMIATADGVMVVVTAVVDRFASHTTSEFLKILQDRLGTAAELDGAFKAIKALDTARSMGAMSDDYAALQARIDAAERCAGNPTQPLTKKAYQEDPAALDRILQQVESTRSEVQQNTLVSVLAVLDKTGASMIKGVPWLGYVVGPATAWSKATLKDMSEQLVAELERAITPCAPDYCAPAAAPRQPDAAPDAPGITDPAQPVTAPASCAAMSGTITWTYHEDYSDPDGGWHQHDITDDRIVLNVRFDRQGPDWVDAGSTFIRSGHRRSTSDSQCGGGTDVKELTWTNSGAFPYPPGEEGSWIQAGLLEDGSAGVEAWIAALWRGHNASNSGVDDSPSGSCDHTEYDYSQTLYAIVSCGDVDGSGDPLSLSGKLSDDGTSADFSCSHTETTPMNDTATQTTTWDVSGTLTIAP